MSISLTQSDIISILLIWLSFN